MYFKFNFFSVELFGKKKFFYNCFCLWIYFIVFKVSTLIVIGQTPDASYLPSKACTLPENTRQLRFSNKCFSKLMYSSPQPNFSTSIHRFEKKNIICISEKIFNIKYIQYQKSIHYIHTALNCTKFVKKWNIRCMVV